MPTATVICPYCHLATRIGTAELFNHVFITKCCQGCGLEFLIVKGVPMTFEEYSRMAEG